jgi:AmmeMemoRadiSam system protein A
MHFSALASFAIVVSLTAAVGWGGQATMNLTKSDKDLLLRVARNAIEAHLKGESASLPESVSPALCEHRGAFVSLHKQGRLRGCIGYLEAVKPLVTTIQEMAAAAAFHDPRFPPLKAEELGDLEVEISVLTPMRRVFQPEEIEVGKHGLYIERSLARGLLLPQVATQYGWDRQTFLEQTCGKAGLPPNAWQDPNSRIYVFSAEIFSEHPVKSASPPQEPKSQ